MNFFSPPLCTPDSKAQAAKEILIANGHHRDLIDIALLRVADLAGAKRKTPRSVRYFVAAVESNLADSNEAAACRRIAESRRNRGTPMDAPLAATEKHDASKISFVQEIVETADREGRPASEVLAERLAAEGRR